MSAMAKSSDSNYPDSRGTATVSNGKIFLVSGMGDLVCISKEGKIIWSVNYSKKYKGVTPDFGISECPWWLEIRLLPLPEAKLPQWLLLILKTEM